MPKETTGAQGLVIVTWERRGCKGSRHRPHPTGSALTGWSCWTVVLLYPETLGQGDQQEVHLPGMTAEPGCGACSAAPPSCVWGSGNPSRQRGRRLLLPARELLRVPGPWLPRPQALPRTTLWAMPPLPAPTPPVCRALARPSRGCGLLVLALGSCPLEAPPGQPWYTVWSLGT